ncbi:hypothetical protein GQ600_4955 [Phytophthora cactorum]|nr:hypothetical protein GQ600_4955 [Phytophthora cactorum]
MNKEQHNICGETDASCDMNEKDESYVMERRMELSEYFAPAMAQNHPVTPNSEDQCKRHFEVRRSDKLANDPTCDLFPHVSSSFFLFGRGHLGEHREVSVPLLECLAYYTMLSQSQFAEDELFSLVAFDRLSLRNTYIQNHFRCQRFPTLYNRYESPTTEQLGRALLENEQRRQGHLPWRPQSDDVAITFLKTVEIGTRSVWGSSGE